MQTTPLVTRPPSGTMESAPHRRPTSMNDERPQPATSPGPPPRAAGIDTPHPDEPTRTAAPQDPAGTVAWEAGQVSMPALPGYEVESVLGRGGMGLVYHA